MAELNLPHFEVHPSVVFQLGESLISDAVQALIELVKNSFDADATYAKIVIDTQGVIDVKGAKYPPTNGRIIVEDDGYGMNLKEINDGWLTISNRKKRELKQSKRTTPGGRTPLGDKGLGRLGVQRLGNYLEIFTKANDNKGFHLSFSWLEFLTASKMDDVKIYLGETEFPRKHGTKVVISDLRELAYWQGEAAIKKLEQELSKMISPYKQIRDFTVFVEVDGKLLELVEVNDSVRSIAPIRYQLTFDGSMIHIEGRARLDHFRPENAKAADEFALMVESDNGKAFFDFLQEQKISRYIGLSKSLSSQWFVEFHLDKLLSDIDKVQRIDGKIANPGPFVGEIDSFDLGIKAFKNQSVFDAVSEYRRHIKNLSGIRVYRDGFAIRVDHDWLKLGAQWTSASSYFGLKPDNTLGFIALSARDNIELEEMTDREGFKDSPYFRNFYSLLEQFKEFTTLSHDFFGRSWTEFRKKRNEKIAQVDSRKTVEDMSQAIKKGLAEAPLHKENMMSLKARITESAMASESVMLQLETANEISPNLQKKISQALSDLQPLLIQANNSLDLVSNYLEELGNLQNLSQVLEDRIDGLRRQMDDMYDTIALGLLAEALSHEIFNIADQLARRTKSAQTLIRSQDNSPRPILTFLEYVQSSIMALRRQMSFLSPSLKYIREQRHEINIPNFIAELSDFYHDRLARNKITITIYRKEHIPFQILMNRGKLTQVIDNLVLNSEYWLKENIAQKRISSGVITIELAPPFIRVFDNGIGIDPSIEQAIFEPFISAKKHGRGLGLFITKQLLSSEGCSFGIVPERNDYNRLYKFQINLRETLHA